MRVHPPLPIYSLKTPTCVCVRASQRNKLLIEALNEQKKNIYEKVWELIEKFQKEKKKERQILLENCTNST